MKKTTTAKVVSYFTQVPEVTVQAHVKAVISDFFFHCT